MRGAPIVISVVTAAVTLGLGLAGAPPARSATGSNNATVKPAKTHPTKAELNAMFRAVPIGQLLCFPETAWVSALDRHYGVVVTQPSCGGSDYFHSWLRRQTISPIASWEAVSRRSGTIDHPAGCTKSKQVPLDVRCL